MLEIFDRLKKSVVQLRSEQEERDKKTQKTMEGKLSSIKSDIKKEVDRDVNATMEHYQRKIEVLEMDLKRQKVKTHLMADVIHQNEQVMNDVIRKLDNIELSNARRSGVLTGLILSKNRKERMGQLRQFLDEALEVRSNIEDSYLLGDGRTCVITFTSGYDKEIAFAAKRNLKYYESDTGSKIYLNEYLPSRISEKRK